MHCEMKALLVMFQSCLIISYTKQMQILSDIKKHCLLRRGFQDSDSELLVYIATLNCVYILALQNVNIVNTQK